MVAMNEENQNSAGIVIEEDVIDDTRFRVVFLNDFKRGTRIAEIREKVRQRFNLSEEGVERMFGGRPIVVKKDVDAEIAYQYKLAIDETGANCKIEVMPQVDDTDIHGHLERRREGSSRTPVKRENHAFTGRYCRASQRREIDIVQRTESGRCSVGQLPVLYN